MKPDFSKKNPVFPKFGTMGPKWPQIGHFFDFSKIWRTQFFFFLMVNRGLLFTLSGRFCWNFYLCFRSFAISFTPKREAQNQSPSVIENRVFNFSQVWLNRFWLFLPYHQWVIMATFLSNRNTVGYWVSIGEKWKSSNSKITLILWK